MKHQKIGGVVATAIALTAIGTGTGAPAFAAKQSAKAALASAPGAFVPLTPARVLDTRSGLGAAKHKVAAQGTVSVTVGGGHGVPSTGVSAVVLNVTAVNTAGSGFVTAYPGGTTRPGASNLNYAKGQTVANLVTVGVSGTGVVTFFNGSAGTVDLLADVAGYYVGGSATDAGMFVSTAPTRLLDTRLGKGAAKHPVAGAATVNLLVGGAAGSPVPAGAAAVVLNVTATTVTKSGFITVYPTGGTKPTASNLNYTAGRTVPNLVTVALGSGNNSVSLYNGSAGSANLVADVAGYYLAGTASKAGAFVPVTPARILDTRVHKGVPDNTPVDPSFDVGLQTVNVGGIPLDNVGAVVANVTVVSPTSTGYVTVSPTDPSRPTVSNINHAAKQTIANLTIVPPGLCSKATFHNGSAGSTHLLADAAGYFLAKDAAGNGTPSKTAKGLGGNTEGELGDGSTTDSSSPVAVLKLHDTKSIDGYGLGLTNDGFVWAWGPDELAQLYPNGESTDIGYNNCSIPQQLGFGGNTIVAIAGSPSDGYAIDLNNDVWSWGYNDDGQLGRGTIGVADFTPGKVNFAGNHDYTAITPGFALRDDGTVWGWGDNSDGRLGVAPATTPRTVTPVQVASATLTGVTDIGQGIAQYAVVGGKVYSWGSNEESGLANGTAADSNPHPTPGLMKDVAGTADLAGVSQVDGDLALMTDGSVVTWGLNDAGQLGNGSAIGTGTVHPVAVTLPQPVVVSPTVQSIASSETNDAVLLTNGQMWVWGGAVANGSAGNTNTPHQVTGLTATDDDILSVGAGFGATFAVVP